MGEWPEDLDVPEQVFVRDNAEASEIAARDEFNRNNPPLRGLVVPDDLREIADRITALGLQTCPICESQTMIADPRPVILPIGGFPWTEPGTANRGNVHFMLLVRCDLCGYAMLFDSERFKGGDELRVQSD